VIGKVLFDYLLAIILLPILLPIIIVLVIISSIDTQAFGLFTQERIGQFGKPFPIYKIRSMKGKSDSFVTTSNSHYITKFGAFIRNTKLDELPQIFNILLGHMSFVGPRPDVKGYANELIGEDREILKFKPGITGPAQIAFKNEEKLLNQQDNPQKYNDEIIWPEKVKINREYVQNWTFFKDLKYIFQTIF
jgi:lipopolysaccharide/colanic/teichoic acid biosynthesis glycosyltransferase